jgi:2-polyprenyl-3-methyl-5-hydroxy-6-metoxy-1,4-benzoquinol methylase
MTFLKEFKIIDGIYSFNITSDTTNLVKDFYFEKPFPSYSSQDDKYSILKKGNENYLSKSVKNKIGNSKFILEVGSGTCQLSSYLAIGTNNNIFALDGAYNSLLLGKKFANQNNISNIHFINADLFDDIFPNAIFDFIWCNGVLHHTKDPYNGFVNLVKKLKKDGIVLVGLYNRFGRIRTIVRKYFYKIFGKKFLFIFDPYLRKLKKNYYKNLEKINAWINDQYEHPVESLHTYGECIKWFNKNGIEYINSIPNLNSNYDLFERSEVPNIYERFLLQLAMPFTNYGGEGGLFIMLGKKK